MNVDVRDLRTAARYVVLEPVVGSFGSVSVNVLNVAEHGLQIEHAQPIRLGTAARVWFKCGNASISVLGLTIWSRLSKVPNSQGKYLYHSGVRLQSGDDDLSQMLRSLATEGRIRPDEHSLERKKQMLAAREQDRKIRLAVKPIHHNGLDPDQLLLVEHARLRLRENPEEAKRWYNRVKFTSSEEKARIAEAAHHREDVLAVWEYLERTVDLSTIIKIFDR